MCVFDFEEAYVVLGLQTWKFILDVILHRTDCLILTYKIAYCLLFTVYLAKAIVVWNFYPRSF